MKKLASFALYTFSIVLAVGIGMGQAGKERGALVGSAGKCTQKVEMPDCATKKCGENPKPVNVASGGSFKDCIANFVPNGYCLKGGDDDCSSSSPTLSCNSDCE